MIKRHYISFNIPRERTENIRVALADIECGKWWRPPPNEHGLPSFDNLFDSEDHRLSALKELAKREGLNPFERIDHIYTDAELRSFPLLVFGANRAPIPLGDAQEDLEFDLSEACPHCGTGGVQTSSLYVFQPSRLPKKGLICETTRGHLLVAQSVAETLRSEEIADVELRQTVSLRRHEPLPWWQVLPRYTIPRISKHSKNIVRDTEPLFNPADPKRGCPVCERDMFGFKGPEPSDWVYDRQTVDPDALPDIVQTWECFGRSVLHDDPVRKLVRGFAQPAILVKPRVFDIFRRLKVRGACFQPVRFIE